ncbi:MAG: addiction module antidote protein, HigA family [Gammaproteobacteria bacterium]|nr:MAG: addiction module antidote protein, HigA family [Gammaproteobacteria bacterium]
MEKQKYLPNIHPGEILKEEFMDPLNMDLYEASRRSGIPAGTLADIIYKRKPITCAIAKKLSRAFGVSPAFWIGLQADFDEEETRRQQAAETGCKDPFSNQTRSQRDRFKQR